MEPDRPLTAATGGEVEQLRQYWLPIVVLFSDAIDKHRITITDCHVLSLLDKPEVVPKASASLSIVMLGELKWSGKESLLVRVLRQYPQAVSIKVGPKLSNPKLDNSAVVERTVYKRIINRILLERWSPHLVGFIAWFECKGFVKYVQRQDKAKGGKDKEFFHALTEAFEKARATVQGRNNPFARDVTDWIILERAQGPTLYNMLYKTTPTPSTTDVYSILFQTIYTLQVFNMVGLRHNDLHSNNIFVEPVDSLTYVYFISTEQYFAVPLNYRVKLIDYDYSSAPGIYNTALDSASLCTSYGICNNPNTKFDVFTLLHAVWEWAVYKGRTEIVQLCYECAEERLYRMEFGYTGRLCWTDELDECVGDWQPPDSVIKTPLQMLQTVSAFAQWKHPVQEFDPKYMPYQECPNVSNLFFLPSIDQEAVLQELGGKYG